MGHGNLEQNNPFAVFQEWMKDGKLLDSTVRGRFPGTESQAQPELPVGYT